MSLTVYENNILPLKLYVTIRIWHIKVSNCTPTPKKRLFEAVDEVENSFPDFSGFENGVKVGTECLFCFVTPVHRVL